ncbi:MAG: EAL domain-containing protein [Singulisphaera sp.]
MDLRTMQVAGAEALVRWLHPREGLMPPGDFIPLAEHTGLIKPLGLLDTRRALMQCHARHQSGLNLNVAVNLAAENLQDPNLVEMVVNRLEGSDSLASWLTLEITERHDRRPVACA